MDLIGIMQEFESFYQIKFGKLPKFVRKVAGDGGGEGARKVNKSLSSSTASAPTASTNLHRYDHDYGIC